jgi:hypothetical protein
VEPQLADFPAEVAGVGLAESFGLLGEQADEEGGAAEVPVAEVLEPVPDLRLDLDRVQPLPCISWYMHPMLWARAARFLAGYVPEAMYAARM